MGYGKLAESGCVEVVCKEEAINPEFHSMSSSHLRGRDRTKCAGTSVPHTIFIYVMFPHAVGLALSAATTRK